LANNQAGCVAWVNNVNNLGPDDDNVFVVVQGVEARKELIGQ